MLVSVNDCVLLVLGTFLFLGASHIFYHYIYTEYKLNTQELSFEDLLVVLNATINTHIELYEKDIFTYKGSITNANFENYYNTMTNEIIKVLAPSFMKRMSFFINEEEVVAIICRRVKEYLSDKVHGTV